MLKQKRLLDVGDRALGEKVTVHENRGCVYVDSLGSPPFAVIVTRRGASVVTDGYKAVSFSDKEWWCGETHVHVTQDHGHCVYYKFTSIRDPTCKSNWVSTPSEAYRIAYFKLTGVAVMTPPNGQLILGLVYDNLQSRVFTQHPETKKLLQDVNDGITSACIRSGTHNKRFHREDAPPLSLEDEEVETNKVENNAARLLLEMDRTSFPMSSDELSLLNDFFNDMIGDD